MRANNAPSHCAEAWLLSFDHGLQAAVGERELQHIVHSPETFTIPLSPFYCEEVLIWNEMLLPVFDLASWLTDGRQTCRNSLIGIVAYRPYDQHTPLHAGLRIESAPKRLMVYEKQACSLPVDIPAWSKIAVSCFSSQAGKPIPVLSLPSVFTYKPEREH